MSSNKILHHNISNSKIADHSIPCVQAVTIETQIY